MNDLYTLDYLKTTISLIESEISDLSTWSVQNNDVLNEEIALLEKALHILKVKSSQIDLGPTDEEIMEQGTIMYNRD